MERISGPFLDCFVAAYAVACEEGYLGFAKLCDEQPTDVWECKAFRKVAAGPCESADAALDEAERKAWIFLCRLRQRLMT